MKDNNPLLEDLTFIVSMSEQVVENMVEANAAAERNLVKFEKTVALYNKKYSQITFTINKKTKRLKIYLNTTIKEIVEIGLNLPGIKSIGPDENSQYRPNNFDLNLIQDKLCISYFGGDAIIVMITDEGIELIYNPEDLSKISEHSFQLLKQLVSPSNEPIDLKKEAATFSYSKESSGRLTRGFMR